MPTLYNTEECFCLNCGAANKEVKYKRGMLFTEAELSKSGNHTMLSKESGYFDSTKNKFVRKKCYECGAAALRRA